MVNLERARRLEGHKNNERQRRDVLRDCFGTIKELLHLDDPKASKLRIIMEVGGFFAVSTMLCKLMK